MYPAGLRICRTSKGLSKPLKFKLTVSELQELFGDSIQKSSWAGFVKSLSGTIPVANGEFMLSEESLAKLHEMLESAGLSKTTRIC
jgi:hypothetical protein